jgi:hypothetical protein
VIYPILEFMEEKHIFAKVEEGNMDFIPFNNSLLNLSVLRKT